MPNTYLKMREQVLNYLLPGSNLIKTGNLLTPSEDRKLVKNQALQGQTVRPKKKIKLMEPLKKLLQKALNLQQQPMEMVQPVQPATAVQPGVQQLVPPPLSLVRKVQIPRRVPYRLGQLLLHPEQRRQVQLPLHQMGRLLKTLRGPGPHPRLAKLQEAIAPLRVSGE